MVHARLPLVGPIRRSIGRLQRGWLLSVLLVALVASASAGVGAVDDPRRDASLAGRQAPPGDGPTLAVREATPPGDGTSLAAHHVWRDPSGSSLAGQQPGSGSVGPVAGSGSVGPVAGSGSVGPVVARGGIDALLGSQEGPPETDNTVTRIDVRADGSARWTVRVRTRLDSETRVEQYRTFQERFRENTSRFLAPFAERIDGTVGSAADATGREMTAGNFSASTSIQEVPRRWGVATFSFTWTGFARPAGDRLVVGDVFRGGLFLAANDSLAVAAPDGYEVVGAEPEPTGNETDLVTWEGREDFADRRPRVELAPTATSTPDPPGTDLLTAAAGALLLVGVLALAVALRRGALPAVVGSILGRDAGESAGSGEAEDAGGGAVLTDAERVERLLADEGGRVRQADVADAFGWSDSKTSRVVADMVEDGRIEKLRIGRENLLDLADDGGDEA